MSGPLSEAEVWGAYSEIPLRSFLCDDGHVSRVRIADRDVISCPYQIGARTACSRPAKPRGGVQRP